MTIQEIKELIQAANESGIAELEVQRGDNRVRIRRSFGSTTEVYAAPQMHSQELRSAFDRGPVASAAGPLAPLSAAADPTLQTVKSPIVGTYYDSPSPDSASFVRVGDVVKPGQVLCIIESMKLMNEIESEVSGTIVTKLVQTGHPVEYGEALFTIRPA